MLVLMETALSRCPEHLRRRLQLLRFCFLRAKDLRVGFFFFFEREYVLILGYKSFIKIR